MSVHQSPRRHSARPQNAYEDGTDEDEQHLLQPVDRYDRHGADGGRQSSPQDHYPRHTQLHTPVRKIANRQSAANDVPFGPYPDASRPAYSAGELRTGTEHADWAYSARPAALPPSTHRTLPPASHRSPTPFVQRSSDLVNDRPPPPAGYYYSDSPYPQPTTREARRRLTPLELAALPLYPEADDPERHTSYAAEQPSSATSRTEHRYHTQNQLVAPDTGGGRGLSSLPSEPTESYADREQKSAFYRNAAPLKPDPPHLYAWKPLDFPKFDGDIRKYPRFREEFDQVYGSHPDLSPQKKLLYLRMHLSGEALTFAQRYMVTDANYTIVLEQLEEKYGDKARLAVTLLQDLVNVQPPSETLEDLRRFCHEVDALQSLLQYAGETWDSHTIAMLVATKLPKSIRIKLVDSYGYRTDSRQTTALLESLNKYVANLAWASTELRMTEKPTDDAPTRRSIAVGTSDLGSLLSCEVPKSTVTEPVVNIQRVAAAVTTTIADKQLRERQTCPLCGLLHSAADCTVYDSTNRRLRRAMKLNLCLLCLREGHPAVSCPRRTTRPCPICRRGQHNRALCKDADDDNQRRDRLPSQVRATRESCSDPEASDQQRHSRTSAPAKLRSRIEEQPVIRDVTCCVATATTLRQSGAQSSRERCSGNLINRKKRTKDLGTNPSGRPGTSRPPTTSTDESIKQKGADAYGGDRLLSGRYHPLQTDRCSNNREMMQFDRTQGDGSDGVPGGMPDEKLSRELYNDEDIPHKHFNGHRTDAFREWSPRAPDEDRFPHYEESTVYVACASDSEQPAVLHECLAVTAMNPVSKKSCRAVIMFDSGSSSSHVSSKLASLLDLPQHEMRVQSVSTFGSKTPMAVNGFRTFLELCSEHGRSLKVNVTALDCIVSSVRTALVRDAVLPALRRNDCPPTATREMPDVLIGQDLVHLFDRQLEPTLPNGLYIVQTSMGPTIGGSYHSVTPPAPEPSNDDSATPPSMDHITTKSSASFNPEDPLNLWTLNDYTPVPAYSAGQEKREPLQDLAYSASPACGDSIVMNASTLLCGRIINEFLEPSTTLPLSGDRPSSPIQARSPQKQIFANPLDTLPLLLPTHSITDVEVEEVSAAYLAPGLPRPIQEPLSSAEAELRCSTPPKTTHGDLISASLEDAGSTLQRKTRLRSCLPECAWQLLGIYTAPESVIAVTLLLPMDSTSTNLPRAERDFQLVLMPSSPSRTIIKPPIGVIQSSHALRLLAVLSLDACAAVLNELSYLIRRQSAAAGKLRTFGRTGSRSDFLCLLRSTRGLPTHASETNDQPSLGSAHSRPPALDGHTTDAAGPQSTPQPLATPPVRPPPHRRTRSSPPSILSRVRIDSHPTHPAADDTSHCCLLRPFGTATSQHLSRVQPSRVLAAYVPCKTCFTSSSLATAHINMGRRKPKTTASNDDACSAFPGPTNNFHRTSGPGKAYRKPTVEQLAADLARTELNHDYHMDNQTMDPGHGTTAPAYSAGQAVIQTAQGARKAKPAVPPAYSAGATGDARRDRQQQPADPDKTARSSSKFCQPSNTQRKKCSSKVKPSAKKRLAAGRQPTSLISKTANPSVLPTYSVGTRGCARQDNKTKSAVQAGKASSTSTIRRPSNQRKQTCLPPATAAPSKAKRPATKDSSRPRGHPAHALASPSGLLSRSVNLSSDIIGHSRDSGLLSQVSRARYSGSTLATKAPRASRLPRGPRADLVDQNLSAHHRCSPDAEAFCHHTTPFAAVAKAIEYASGTAPTISARTTATPAVSRGQPLVPAYSKMRRACAFCQSPHWSVKCTVYASTSQRLNRARKLQLCFVCLREGHHTTSCPTEAKTCKYCFNGTHHRALCRNDASNHNRAITKSTVYFSFLLATLNVTFVVVGAAPSVANGVRELAALNSRVASIPRISLRAPSLARSLLSSRREWLHSPQQATPPPRRNSNAVAANSTQPTWQPEDATSPPAGGLDSVRSSFPIEEGDWGI